MNLVKWAGPMVQPVLSPVAENNLPAEYTEMVLSHYPGKFANLGYFNGS